MVSQRTQVLCLFVGLALVSSDSAVAVPDESIAEKEAGDPGVPPPIQESMKSLSAAIRALEHGLDANDAEALSARAAELRTQSEGLVAMLQQHAIAGRVDFESLAQSTHDRSEELFDLVKAGKVAEASAALDSVRRSCIECHVRSRVDNVESGMYPARQNTVFGRVDVSTLAGAQREDSSNIVVFLDRAAKGIEYPPPRRSPVISQAGRRFEPRVLPVVVNTTVEMPNDDVIFHNVFSLSSARAFDLGIYEPGDSRRVKFDKCGLVRVFCNIHPQMACNILVLKNPYFAVTDSEGYYVITEVPDGTYTLRTWHELGGEARREVSLSNTSTREVDLSIKETKRAVGKHRNKFGKPYGAKYR